MNAHRHLPMKPVVLEILLALGESPLHGYAILQAVRERSGADLHLETGPLYRYLRRLLKDGLVEETDEPAEVSVSDERRRYYRLTKLGSEVVRLESERLRLLVKRTRELGLAGP